MEINLPNGWAPTLVQERSYEVLASGSSAIISSPTGTGKTLAYLLPLIAGVKPGVRNQIIVVAPSKELASQIAEVARSLGANVAALIGGGNVKRQIEKLKKNPEVVVGTLGRLSELVAQKKLKMHSAETIVFDEADQLIENEAAKFLRLAPKDYQLVFVSATALSKADELAGLIRSGSFEIVEVDKDASPKADVTHGFVFVKEEREIMSYLKSISNMEGMRAIVFFNRASEAEHTAYKLKHDGVKLGLMSSNESKFERDLAMKMFRRGELSFIFTTDALARGIDFDNIKFVINVRTPLDDETYIHRSGRVGRINSDGLMNSGAVVSLVNHKELKWLRGHEASVEELYVYSGRFNTEPKKRGNS
ncbi:MAG: DEAD/DEAH box helicase [Lactobacillales bacterium]|jgi:superfamily II DNA/RNA helicase|nr:DEAD/DEAH box helicase [Lactobacillales bacterium]